MERKSLAAVARSETGKQANGRLRRKGKIPAIIYGYTQPTTISLDAHEFKSAFKRIPENAIIELTLGNDTHEVLVKDYQEDALTGEILHIDFYEFKRGVALRTHVPVRLTGVPLGVKEGGILENLVHEVDVECLPKDLPEVITLDISGLALGHSLRVEDLPRPEAVRLLNPADQVVCLVAHRKAEEVAAPAAEEEVAEEAPEEGAEEKEEESEE